MLAFLSFFTVVPYLRAMVDSVSPLRTLWYEALDDALAVDFLLLDLSEGTPFSQPTISRCPMRSLSLFMLLQRLMFLTVVLYTYFLHKS